MQPLGFSSRRQNKENVHIETHSHNILLNHTLITANYLFLDVRSLFTLHAASKAVTVGASFRVFFSETECSFLTLVALIPYHISLVKGNKKNWYFN